jgi:hypothetical protein
MPDSIKRFFDDIAAAIARLVLSIIGRPPAKSEGAPPPDAPNPHAELPDSQTLVAHFEAMRAARGSLEGAPGRVPPPNVTTVAPTTGFQPPAPAHEATQSGAAHIVAADPGQPQARIDLAQFEAAAQALHFRTEGPRELPTSPWANLPRSPVVSAQSPNAPISTPQVPSDAAQAQSGAARVPGSATPDAGLPSAAVPSHEAPQVHPNTVAAGPGQPQAQQPAAVPAAPPRASEPEPPGASEPVPPAPSPAATSAPVAASARASNLVAADPGQPQARIDRTQFEAAAQALHFPTEGPRELSTSPWANLPRTAVVSSQAASAVPQAHADVSHSAPTPGAGASAPTETTGLPDWPVLPEWPLAWYEPAPAERAPLRERAEGAWYV